MTNKYFNNMLPPSYDTKVEVICNTLLSAILHEKLKAGEHLNIGELAKRFATSNGPVREALRTLYTRGLIKYSPHKGYIVYNVDSKEIEKMFLIISILSEIAAQEAFENIDGAVINELDQLLTQAENCATRSDFDSWIELTQKFHVRIVKCAQSELLREMITRLRERSFLISRNRAVLKKRVPRANEEHRQILSALRSGSKEEFVRLLREHELGTARAYVDAAEKARVAKV